MTEADAPGPAAARNAGAARATGEVIVFVDADVEPRPDAFARIRAAFDAEPELGALFGSYDADPEASGIVSRFRNLLHHTVHQGAAGRAETFWAGLGAIRRDLFLAVGGFDAERYPEPSVEDIELGMRLSAAGALVRLDPLVQGTHLKRWTLVEMLRTDLLRRGIPWVVLLLRERRHSRALNLGWRHRLSTMGSLTALVALAARRLRLLATAIAALLALNRPLYVLLYRRWGPLHAALGVPLLVAHHAVAALSVPLGAIVHLRERWRSPWGERGPARSGSRRTGQVTSSTSSSSSTRTPSSW